MKKYINEKDKEKIMISAKPTDKLTGITLEGNYDDFYEVMRSIHRITWN